MQGQIRGEHLTVRISTECAHCARSLHIVMDNEMSYRVEEDSAEPLVFHPQVNWGTFSGSNIIDAY